MKNISLFFGGLLFLSGCFKKEATVSQTSSLDSSAKVEDSAAYVSISAPNKRDSAITFVSSDSINDATLNRKMNYSEALSVNTSQGWRTFLADNPDYPKKGEIEDKIIRAEVNEISSDRNTGEMPSAEKIGSSSSSQSKVIIENDTSCDLTIRYSGPDARKIIIAPNSKGTINLGSGNYTVAASACSYNYAGSENLSGDYSVVYYISSVRY